MTDRKYSLAAMLLFASAALHVVVLLVTFPTLAAPPMVGIVIWGLLGVGLLRGARWAAWLAFLGSLIAMIAALSNAVALFGTVAAVYWIIFAIHVSAAALLFAILWSPGRSKANAPEG